MTGDSQSRTSVKPSINYRYNPHGGPFFDLVDVTREDYAPSSHDNRKQPSQKAESRSSSIVSTTDLISGAGQLWNFATSSLPVLRHRTSTQNNDNLQKANTFYYPAEEGNVIASIPSETQNVSINLKAKTHVSPTVDVQKDLDSLHVAKKLSSFDCFSDSHHCYHLLRSCKEKRISSVMISNEFQNVYGWMTDIQLSGAKYKKRTDYCSNAVEINGVETIDPDDATRLNDVTTSHENTNNMIKTSASVMSLCSDYLLHPIEEKENDLSEIIEGQDSKFVNHEVCTSTSYKLAKQEHAFAGAFAGIFVSLCLHPMDTVKTVIQSCPTDQRSIPYISKSIISERGLSGLYRGITSNIASSAPISAIYTFSYESVKGALLPLFAKEHQSLAHCIAGGCASVATSFVFTPSERIKQQMQVGSHYHSCWNAFWGIVGKGGFSSLYNGWGAVLCRNVPHSIIKFYTYESLKKLMSLHQAHAQPTTLSTLLCGGLAGSTAALFTTPFDVVKTRLQTQIPGSVNRYHGVFDTLKDIAQHEGPKGLYRGLTPRLAMYMTQGALFFASYESFKRGNKSIDSCEDGWMDGYDCFDSFSLGVI
ncbi:unnamed protein product [Lactuca virosa]|uniref:Mitochondrial carrier protein n=1 Tax=Lactuca virosa TaxID=75947 RepID=A0AAU9PNG3_9ASTR|nr:unnamed protein product [Lactuca virosa]